MEGKKRAKKKTSINKFYLQVLDEAEQIEFEQASGIQGIDDEITLLRVKIKGILERDPDNIRLIMDATNAVAKLVNVRYNITREQKQGLKEGIANVLEHIGVSFGIGLGTIIEKKAGL